MAFVKLIILVIVFLFIRRVYLSVKKQLSGSARPQPGAGRSGVDPRSPAGSADGKKFREEDISDADFEEIP